MSTKLRNCNGKRSQVRDFCIKRYLKQASLIEGKVMITVTNIIFMILKDMARSRKFSIRQMLD